MKKILPTLFPWKLYLNILQLEEYQYSRFLKWLSKNLFARNIIAKKNLVVTPKVKTIIHLSILWLAVLTIITSLLCTPLAGIVIFLLLIIQPHPLFALALLILKPYEILNKKRVIAKNRKLILNNKNLKVISIVGSYAKTSIKEILYQLIKDKYKTLKTPESFNTVFGINKVTDLELDNSYQYFICEMAAYQKGEINELMHMIPPSLGVITGIASQHLERFGSLKNIISAKFEPLNHLSTDKMTFNLDNKSVIKELQRRNINKTYGYGINATQAQIQAKNIKLTKKGSKFTLIIDGKKYQASTSLFGFANIQNILAATALAHKINLTDKEILEKIKTLIPFSNRNELKKLETSTLVDNTFSSNEQAFIQTLKAAQAVKGKKILITPGLVELGTKKKEIHLKLGKLAAGVFNQVVLVGKNNRTRSLAQGIGNKPKPIFINDNRDQYSQAVNNAKNKFNWIFLENDVTQNY